MPSPVPFSLSLWDWPRRHRGTARWAGAGRGPRRRRRIIILSSLSLLSPARRRRTGDGHHRCHERHFLTLSSVSSSWGDGFQPHLRRARPVPGRRLSGSEAEQKRTCSAETGCSPDGHARPLALQAPSRRSWVHRRTTVFPPAGGRHECFRRRWSNGGQQVCDENAFVPAGTARPGRREEDRENILAAPPPYEWQGPPSPEPSCFLLDYAFSARCLFL